MGNQAVLAVSSQVHGERQNLKKNQILSFYQPFEKVHVGKMPDMCS